MELSNKGVIILVLQSCIISVNQQYQQTRLHNLTIQCVQDTQNEL